MAITFSATQGEYLAFIHAYTTLHRRPPAERDFLEFFRVTPPTVHTDEEILSQQERWR